MTQATFKFRKGNPDVLTSIANLSNDEVFTPPEFANQMLDTLQEAWASSNGGANIWEDSTVTFLDPFTKSGVFLREITERLTHGLEEQIPDLQERVNHILTKQVFGIGITQLTSLLARRSVYCSKWANGEHSIATAFENEEGNIWFERTEHTWVGGKNRVIVINDEGVESSQTTDGKCKYCGASQKDYGRGESLETHAYAFIHSANIEKNLEEIFGEKLKFDVIVGNPPYQLNTEGHGTQARPIYNYFVDQAKLLDPNFICMVIPARWFTGGMGLDSFRESMLNDDRLAEIFDYADSSQVFPGTQIKGGVCYFLWDSKHSGSVRVTNIEGNQPRSVVERQLLENGADVFIRYNEALPILKKIFAVELATSIENVKLDLPENKRFSEKVSSIGAFGLESTFKGKERKNKSDVLVYRNGGTGYIARQDIAKERHMIDEWKVFIPRAGSGSDSFPHSILGKPFIGEPGSISSWTYMYIGPFKSQLETSNVISYIHSKIFRFLVLLHKPTQDATKAVYTFVPTQDFSVSWTDEALAAKYGLSQEELDFIDSMIRPMGEENE